MRDIKKRYFLVPPLTEADFASPVTENLTLYGRRTKAWTVTFSLNGGAGGIPSQIIPDGETAALPASPSKDGYRFNGWFTQTGETAVKWDFATAVRQNISLSADWVKVWTVTFVLNGGRFSNGRPTTAAIDHGELRRPLPQPSMTRR
jgi:uncharacterized repeat protein (TIGR02543 family)